MKGTCDVINLALEAGRALQREQTGFVHFCHQSDDLKTHDTIPVLENALFALSLFRTRLAENVLEGKAILERLLAFETGGSFPTYLHAYPEASDPYLGLRLLPIFFWISIDFGHVIGGLKLELERCMERILAHAPKWTASWAQFRLMALEGKVGPLPQNLHEWGEGLISLQIAEKRGADIQETLRAALQLWHPDLSLYIGPSTRRNQEGHLPELTLFDLFMSQWQKHFTDRTGKIAPIHLHGALIRPLGTAPEFPDLPVPYIEFHPQNECPLLIAWDRHTFVLAKQQHRIEGSAEEIKIYPNEELVSFYFNHHSDHRMFVEGQKSNTFRQNQRVEIQSKELRIAFQFFAEDGLYMGHILRGNRPSQHRCKGENEFAAYDWQIAIRTIEKGSSPLIIRFYTGDT